jgi:hypothetical protein
MKTLLTLFMLAVAASAQPSIAPPQIGFLKDGSGSFRPVLGIAGNFLMGPPAYGAVANAAYSGSFGLVKTDTAILAIDNQGRAIATMDAPGGPALFAFQGDGSPAFAYLPGSHLLFEWIGAGFQMVPVNSRLFPAGAVRAIFAPDAAHVGLLVERLDGLQDIRILLDTGEADSEAAIPGVRGAVLILPAGQLIYTEMTGVVVRNADGVEVHIPGQISVHCSLAQMGAGWVEVTDHASSSRFAVRVNAGREGFFALPEVSQ